MVEKEYRSLYKIEFTPAKVCTYYYHIETRNDTGAILNESEEKYRINPNHNFNEVSVPDEVHKACDKEWTQEVKDAWIKRLNEYPTMSPIKRVEAGYR